MYKKQREYFGFGDAGFITVCKGESYPYKDWLKEQGARYFNLWGWYFPSALEVPSDLPSSLSTFRLEWTQVGDENGDLFEIEKVRAAIDTHLYDPTPSHFVGSIGDRLELIVTVKRVIDLDGYYGISHMHVMEDENGNTFIWTTASKRWEDGSVHHIRGTVKEHRMYRNSCNTCLIRCSEVKEK